MYLIITSAFHKLLHCVDLIQKSLLRIFSNLKKKKKKIYFCSLSYIPFYTPVLKLESISTSCPQWYVIVCTGKVPRYLIRTALLGQMKGPLSPLSCFHHWPKEDIHRRIRIYIFPESFPALGLPEPKVYILERRRKALERIYISNFSLPQVEEL